MAGKGNHSRGEAALPVAVKSFPREIHDTTEAYENRLSFVSISEHQCLSDFGLMGETGNSGSARDVPDKGDILEDASEIEQIGVNGIMKEVGPEGEKQSKEANDEDVQVLKHESNFDSICYFFSIIMRKYKDMNLAKQVEWLPVRG
ncbi:hypothetical protein Tco_0374558 [Tanacetum coccineum]